MEIVLCMVTSFILFNNRMGTYIVNFLEFGIAIALFTTLMHFFTSFWVKQITQATTASEAAHYRMQLKWIRWGLLLLFTTAYIWLELELNAEKLTPTAVKYMVAPIFSYLITQRYYRNWIGNISTLTKESFIKKHPHYVLYLRGFADDVYGDNVVRYGNGNSKRFSEYAFVSTLDSIIRVCAVGMTKEIDAPYGAERVYLDDETWKNDVFDLMENAAGIFIYANERPSCVWEMKQSISLKQKTCLIFDDVNRYENIRKEIGDKLNLPPFLELGVTTPFCLHWVEKYREGFVLTSDSFESSEEGYRKLFIKLPGIDVKKESPFFRFLKRFALFIVFLEINLVAGWKLMEAFHIESIPLLVLIIILLFGFEWVVYMLSKVYLKDKNN